MNITSMITTLIIALFVATLTWFASIKIKYAKNEQEAMRKIRLIIFPVILLTIALYLGVNIFNEIISPEPLTKVVLFLILGESFSMFFIFANCYAMIIYYMLSKQ